MNLTRVKLNYKSIKFFIVLIFLFIKLKLNTLKNISVKPLESINITKLDLDSLHFSRKMKRVYFSNWTIHSRLNGYD